MTSNGGNSSDWRLGIGEAALKYGLLLYLFTLIIGIAGLGLMATAASKQIPILNISVDDFWGNIAGFVGFVAILPVLVLTFIVVYERLQQTRLTSASDSKKPEEIEGKSDPSQLSNEAMSRLIKEYTIAVLKDEKQYPVKLSRIFEKFENPGKEQIPLLSEADALDIYTEIAKYQRSLK
ncbi:MAG: hypothetical protein L6Q98_16790 [Anaerolineae bacterium]|nr:hypothetical protein [Anaerolineae bacterium]NUQ03904.1 hypothetical protein [Anaerolineae bacterium]